MAVSITSLRGRTNDLKILTPDSAPYRKSVWTGNRLHWKEKPSLVIHCTTRAHVEAGIIFARILKSSITVKNTGHSYAGWANNHEGILLDVSGIRYAEIDSDEDGGNAVLTVGGGAIWLDAYKLLADFDQTYGTHIIVGGRCPGVGVAGFTLGGGLSPFTRGQGLGMDHLKEVTLVTAKPGGVGTSTVVVQRDRDVELFDALCGGGGGNFGVITELKFNVPQLNAPEGQGLGRVVTGRFTRWGTMQEQLAFAKPLYDTPLENNLLTVDASWLFDAKTSTDNVGIRFTVYYDGKMEKFIEDTNAFLGNRAGNIDGPAGRRLAQYLQDNTHEESCTSLLEESLEEHWSDEQKRFVTATNSYSIYSSFIFKHAGPGNVYQAPVAEGADQPAAVARTNFYQVLEYLPVIRDRFHAVPGNAGSSGQFQLSLIHGGGAAVAQGRHGEAFPWRQGEFFAYITVVWTEKHLHYKGRMQAFVDNDCNEVFESHSLEGRACFMNFGGSSKPPGGSWKKSYYGSDEAYAQLQYVKFMMDPDNIFGEGQTRQEFRPSIEPNPLAPAPAPEADDDAAVPVLEDGEAADEAGVDEDAAEHVEAPAPEAQPAPPPDASFKSHYPPPSHCPPPNSTGWSLPYVSGSNNSSGGAPRGFGFEYTSGGDVGKVEYGRSFTGGAGGATSYSGGGGTTTSGYGAEPIAAPVRKVCRLKRFPKIEKDTY